MGSGKTIIGKKLAQELDLPFIDSDARIVETAGISIAEIFDIAGEAKFRARKETPPAQRLTRVRQSRRRAAAPSARRTRRNSSAS